MSSAPRVTVLLAVHNGARHVGAAIESLLGQTFGDLELLVVDDGSTDETPEIVRSFDDARVHLHRSERNLGIPAALNLGLELARGEYVARADHDDVSLPARLEREVAALDAGPQLGAVGTWFDVIDGEGHTLARPRERIGDFVDFVYLLLIDRMPLHQPTSMFRREAVLALGGYDPLLQIAEDKDLWRRLALARWEAAIVPESLVHYRVHPSQQTQVEARRGRELDVLVQERFLTALGSADAARELRLLLGGRLELWESQPSAARLGQLVDGFLTDAAARLELTDAESRRLRRLVAARVARVATGAWRRGPRTQWQVGTPLVRYGISHARPLQRARIGGAYGLALALAPALYAGRAMARGGFAWLVDRPALGRLRARAARSPVLRRMYAALRR